MTAAKYLEGHGIDLNVVDVKLTTSFLVALLEDYKRGGVPGEMAKRRACNSNGHYPVEVEEGNGNRFKQCMVCKTIL